MRARSLRAQYAGYGKDSRGTHLFLTLGNQPGLGKSPWEVPVGKVISGLDVMHGIYTGYGDKVCHLNSRGLTPSSTGIRATVVTCGCSRPLWTGQPGAAAAD